MSQRSVLLVEDSEDDQILLRQAFARANITTPMQIVSSGEEAIAYLRGDGPFANRNDFPMPGLVLLDLKMPGKSGFDVLSWIRDQPSLRKLRVVVLTSSDAVWDIRRAYELGAASFLLKPVDFEDFKELGKALRAYWLGWNVRPDEAGPETIPNPPGEDAGQNTPG